MLRNVLHNMDELEARLLRVAPAGYMLALNIRHLTPEFFQSSYPADWITIYTQKRYLLLDPIVLWARFSHGCTRWSEVHAGFVREPGRLVLEHARSYGLSYGGAVSTRGPAGGHRLSLLTGARQDRELDDAELAELASVLEEMVAAVGDDGGLGDSELQALQDLASGLSHNEIAALRGISAATVKKRIERTRVALCAKNGVHAVAIAIKRGLILTGSRV